MYTIVHKKTGKYLYGTDYRQHPYKQRCSRNKALIYDSLYLANFDFLHRKCSTGYEIAEVEMEVKQIHEPVRSMDELETMARELGREYFRKDVANEGD